MNRERKQQNSINRQVPEYWRLEIFYFNRKDKSVLVPSRYGAGFAFNYGHKVVQVVMGLLGAAALAAIVILFVL